MTPLEKAAHEYASRWNVSWAHKEWNHDVDSFISGAQHEQKRAEPLVEKLKQLRTYFIATARPEYVDDLVGPINQALKDYEASK